MCYPVTHGKVPSAIRKKPIGVVDENASIRIPRNCLFPSAGMEDVTYATADEFLAKPFDYSKLIEVVEAAMDSDAAGQHR